MILSLFSLWFQVLLKFRRIAIANPVVEDTVSAQSGLTSDNIYQLELSGTDIIVSFVTAIGISIFHVLARPFDGSFIGGSGNLRPNLTTITRANITSLAEVTTISTFDSSNYTTLLSTVGSTVHYNILDSDLASHDTGTISVLETGLGFITANANPANNDEIESILGY